VTDIVPAGDIERIVGVPRHATEHWGRAVSAEQQVYILHSQECLDDPRWGLEDCLLSLALDQGIDLADWVEDVPVRLGVRSNAWRDWLIPAPPENADPVPHPEDCFGCDREWAALHDYHPRQSADLNEGGCDGCPAL
jgi:hypothetical protein